MMVYKIFEELGDFIRVSDNQRVNILFANEAHTPQGLNVGWTGLTTNNFRNNMVMEPIEEHVVLEGYTYDPLTEEELQLLRENQSEVLI